MGVYLGLESLVAGNGGICRVARLITRVVDEELTAGRMSRSSGCVLSDKHTPSEFKLPVRVCGGSRVKFAVECSLAKLHSTHAVYDFVGLAAAHTVLPLPRRPYLAYIHGIEVWQGWTKSKYLRAADRAEVLVSNSQYTIERSSRTHPPMRRAVVCWLGTEDDDAPVVVPPTGPPRVTIIGRMENERYKGHTELIDAWPAVRSAVRDAVLTVVGRGPQLTSYQQQAASLGLSSEEVEFRGFVAEEEMAAVWASTHVFAMPSRGEGFGLVYIEAMRQGRPVIGSTHDAAVEVNLDGLTGYNVNLDRPGELTDRLIHLLRNPDLSRQLGESGRGRWAAHFRFSSFRDRFLPILRGFMNGG